MPALLITSLQPYTKNMNLATYSLIFILASVCANAVPDWMPGKTRYEKWQIDSWNETHKDDFNLKLTTMKVVDFFGDGNCPIVFSGSVINKSREGIEVWILDLAAIKKSNGIVVLTRRVSLEWRSPKSINNEFKSMHFYNFMRSEAEFEKIIKQLGADMSWSCKFVAAIPESMKDFKFKEAYEVDENWGSPDYLQPIYE